MGLRQVSVKDSDGKDVDLTEFIGSDELDAQNLVSQVAEAAAEDEDKAEENEEA